MTISRRKFLRESLVAAGVLGVSTLGYGFLVEPGWIEVTHTTIPIRNLGSSFNPLRIVHLSDIHYGYYINEERLKDLISLVNGLKADLILHTGDFVYGLYAFLRQAKALDSQHSAEAMYGSCVPLLAEMRSRLGSLAVPGNHDHYVGLEIAEKYFRENHLDLLVNDHRVISDGESSLTIAGVDDLTTGNPDLFSALKDAPPSTSSPRILLSHNPDYADNTSISGSGVQLMLSGHTHGGQVTLPGLDPPVLPVYNREYARGLVRTDWGFVYINRGVGVTNPPVRLFTRPEVAVIELVASQESATSLSIQRCIPDPAQPG